MPKTSPNTEVNVIYNCPVSGSVTRVMKSLPNGDIPATIPDPADEKQFCTFVSFTTMPAGGTKCFLATACVEYAGLPDDCEELRIMRRFRDEYVSRLPEGPALIQNYYQAAPGIVRRIQADGQRDLIFGYMLTRLREVTALIQAGRQAEAHELYMREYRTLQARYPQDS
jgi:hypothetical protein